MTLKKLPIGIHTFSEIREENYVYVDKTKEAYELINNYKYVFLSRPRRFGKSLFLDTLQNIFEGNKELFKGLYIYDKWNFNDKYPVIKISWAGDLNSLKKLEIRAIDVFEENQERLGIECNTDEVTSCFNRLIKKAYKKYNQKVVVLIDEYDKPIQDVIDNLKQAEENRKFLRGFYNILKDNDQYIRFVFLTGVSKFTKASIFSGFNNLEDVSLIPEFGSICGYTEKEINKYFKDYLKGVDINELREWYNGYWFLKTDEANNKEKVYNPFSVLKCLKYKKFTNYWFESGMPDFLYKLIKKHKYDPINLEGEISASINDSIGIESINFITLLYQTGYLTIDEVLKEGNSEEYRLKFPNYEVKSSYYDAILKFLIKSNT